MINNLTSEIISRINPKLGAVVLIVSNPSIHLVCVLAITLNPAIDDPDGGSKALTGSYGIMHLFGCPEPKRRLEGYNPVGTHSLRSIKAVEVERIAGVDVVVVPCKLKRTTAKVLLVGIAWICCASLAVVLASSINFINVAEIYTKEQGMYMNYMVACLPVQA